MAMQSFSTEMIKAIPNEPSILNMSPLRPGESGEERFSTEVQKLKAYAALWGVVLDPIHEPTSLEGLPMAYGYVRALYINKILNGGGNLAVPLWAQPPPPRPRETEERYRARFKDRFDAAYRLYRALKIHYEVQVDPLLVGLKLEGSFENLDVAVVYLMRTIEEKEGAIPAIFGEDISFIEARAMGVREYGFRLLGLEPSPTMGAKRYPGDDRVRRDELVDQAEKTIGTVHTTRDVPPSDDETLPPSVHASPRTPRGPPRTPRGHFTSELGPQFDPDLHAELQRPGLRKFGDGRYDLTDRATRTRFFELYRKYKDADPVTDAEKAEYEYMTKLREWTSTPAGWDRLVEIGEIPFPDHQETVRVKGKDVTVMRTMHVPEVGAGARQLRMDRKAVRTDESRASRGVVRSTEMTPAGTERDWRVTSMHHSEPWWLKEPGNPNRLKYADYEGWNGGGPLEMYKQESSVRADVSDYPRITFKATAKRNELDDIDVQFRSNPPADVQEKGLLFFGHGNYRFEDLDGWSAPPWYTGEASGDTDAAPAWNVPPDVINHLDSIDNSPKDERLYPVAMGFVKDVPKVEGWGDNVYGLDELRANLETNIIEPQEHPELFRGLIQPSRTTLMYGPAGTGKTTVATKIAAMAGGLFAHVVPSRLLGGYVSSAAKIIELLYQGLKKSGRPCIVFFDECEKLIGSRTSGTRSEQLDRVVQALLVWTDEDQVKAPIYTIYATNIPQNVDAAILSRISLRVPVWLPGAVDRRHFLAKFFKTAVTEGLAMSTVGLDSFVDEMVALTKWRSFRTLKLTLRSTLKVKITVYLHRRRREGRKGPIHRDAIGKLGQDDFRKALRDSLSSEPECDRLMDWARETKTPMSAMLPIDYQYKEDFARAS